jgi:hypothetical protein
LANSFDANSQLPFNTTLGAEINHPTKRGTLHHCCHCRVVFELFPVFLLGAATEGFAFRSQFTIQERLFVANEMPTTSGSSPTASWQASFRFPPLLNADDLATLISKRIGGKRRVTTSPPQYNQA